MLGYSYMVPETRDCPECGVSFSVAGRQHRKLFCSARCRSLYRTTSGTSRHNHLRATFRISEESYLQLLDSQGGTCAICARLADDNGNRLAVDHDHSCCPGLGSCGNCIRGVLCRECNRGLGLMGEREAALLRAAQYLRQPPFLSVPTALMSQRIVAPTIIDRNRPQVCEVCATPFASHPIGASRRRFCSRTCKDKARIARGGKRDGWRWTRYRLTEPAYAALLDAQGHACAICGRASGYEGKSLAVDHDATCCGPRRSAGCCIRGLLCGACNQALGCYDHSTDRLLSAAAYLNRWSG